MVTFDILSDDGVLNRWPGDDGYIGTDDDTTGSDPSPAENSAPNSGKSYSYEAFDFGSGQADAGYLPTSMNAATFLAGSVVIDADIAQTGGGQFLKGFTLGGTEPFIGHGDYSATVTKVNSGTYDATTKDLTVDFDISATLAAGTATATGIALTGKAYMVLEKDFETATGNAYLDGVLLPVAKAKGAKALVFIDVSGTVPMSSGGSGGSFPEMPMKCVIVGISSL